MKGDAALSLLMLMSAFTANPFQEHDRRYASDQYRYRRLNHKFVIEQRTMMYGIKDWETLTDKDGNMIYIDTEWDANKIVRKLNSSKED